MLLAPAQHHYGDGADHGDGGDDDDDEKEGGDDGERQLRRRQACPFCQYYLETHPGAVLTSISAAHWLTTGLSFQISSLHGVSGNQLAL